MTPRHLLAQKPPYPHPALIETPLQAPRGSAKEGSTVVSTVKDTRAATSSMVKPRRALVHQRVGSARRRGPTCAARPPLHLQQKRRFAAEIWVKPEVDPPSVSRCRAGL